MIKIFPRITVVTPSLNQGEFLEECIDSVLCQHYPNLEYIIMDGGSEDNSIEIIKKYQKYLTYWQSKRDGGQYAAIGEGFRRSSGEILAWLNSDDKYHNNALIKVAYIFSINPDVEWLTGRPTCWDKSGNLARVFRGTLPDYCRESHLKKEYLGVAIQQESTFWRRSLWERAGGYLRGDLEFAGDLELWNRFYRLAELYKIDDLLAGFRVHGRQKSLMFLERYIAEAEKVIKAERKNCINIDKSNKTTKLFSISMNELNLFVSRQLVNQSVKVITGDDNRSIILNNMSISNSLWLKCARYLKKTFFKILVFFKLSILIRYLYNIRNMSLKHT
ncbi:MAG: glycosyl transferase family [Geobacteraceae bacterium]|nr:MAG: glycosyl transferase family [Geobacteraceae bacterium]